MSGAAPVTRELIGFEGAVGCEQRAQGTSLRLRGTARGGPGPGPAEVCFSDVALTSSARGVPAVLQEVRVLELTSRPAAPRRICRIDTSAGSFELQAGSVHVHRDATRPFFTAVPPIRAPYAMRLGWALLLTLLRVPGAARVLAKLRG